MGFVKVAILPLSRFFISAVFIFGALKDIFSWNQTEKALIDQLSTWQVHFAASQDLQSVFAFFISWSFPLLLFTVGAIFFGGVCILMGFKERFGISLLIACLVPTTIIYHPFWWVDGPSYERELAMFLKNLAIIGCLIKLRIHETVYEAPSNPPFERY